MNLILSLVVLFAITIAFLTYRSDSHWSLKSVVLPIFLIIALLGYEHYVDHLGKPLLEKPKGDYEYHHHVVTSESNIIAWVRNRDGEHRLYKFPYNREDAKKLEKAKQETKRTGKPVRLKFKMGEISRVKDSEEWDMLPNNPVKQPEN